MASPQKENGYTAIANEILEELCRTNLSSYQARLLFIIWRRTYGFNKNEDWLSNSQLTEFTGLRPQHVSRAKKELLLRKIITNRGNKVGFNKDHSQWIELPIGVRGHSFKKVTPSGSGVTNRGLKVTPSGVKRNPIGGTQKNNTTKDIIQKKGSTPKEKMKEFILNVQEKGGSYMDLVEALAKTGLDNQRIKDEIENFVSYWTELNGSGKKELWEMQKTFEVKRRLLTWFRNIDKFSGRKKQPSIAII